MTDLQSLAGRSDQQLGTAGSVLVRPRREHEELERLLVQLDRSSGVSQDEVLTKLSRRVFSHVHAEEVVLVPVVRSVSAGGHERTLQVEREHQLINKLWSALERTPHGDAGRRGLLDRLFVVLRQDARDQEDDLLPRLQAVWSLARLRAVGLARELVDRTSPTRPYALVSRRPPGNALSGLRPALLDRSRDALDRRGRKKGHAAQVARRASSAFAGVAAALENVPPFRVGQDPATRAGGCGQQPSAADEQRGSR